MKSQLFFFVAIFNASAFLAQTNVSGGIYNNTSWTKVNSPYIVVGNIVLFPDKTLTIEPGVEVKFDGYYNLEIRGSISAVGTINDSIKFVSNNSQAQDAWDNIRIQSSLGATGFFEYCTIENSDNGIFGAYGDDSVSFLRKSKFENNNFALRGWSSIFSIDSCIFINNAKACSTFVKQFTNCLFENNIYGLYGGNGDVYNSVFINNGTADSYNNGKLDNCILINNNIAAYEGTGEIINCKILNNTIGILTYHQSYTFINVEYYVPIKNNQICHNTTYDVKNMNDYNKNITKNCFCTDDSTEVESKLYDGYDDITKGLFNYDIYDTSCQNVIQTVYKVGSSPSTINSIISKNNLFSFFPNPVKEELSIVFNNQLTAPSEIVLFNNFGKIIFSAINQKSVLNLNLGNLPNGLFLLEIKNNDIIHKEKIIKI